MADAKDNSRIAFKYAPLQSNFLNSCIFALEDIFSTPPFSVPWRVNRAGQAYYFDRGRTALTLKRMERKLFHEYESTLYGGKNPAQFIQLADDIKKDFNNISASVRLMDSPNQYILAIDKKTDIDTAIKNIESRIISSSEKIAQNFRNGTTQEIKTSKRITLKTQTQHSRLPQ